jgi:hypothetical protein
MKEQTFEDYRQRMPAVLVHIQLSGHEVLAAPVLEFYLNSPQDMPPRIADGDLPADRGLNPD